MLGPIEQAGHVLLGLADVLGHDHGEIDFVDLSPRHLTEHRRGERLAGSGRPKTQRPATGPELVAHVPLIHEDVAMTDPILQVPDFRQCARRQHDVVPLHGRFEALSRKPRAHARDAQLAQQKPIGVIVVERQIRRP